MKKSIATFVFLILNSVIAVAADLPAEYLTVKIVSKPCNAGIPEYMGSAVAFRYGDSAYAITSDHVIINGDIKSLPSICHEIRSKNGLNGKADLIRSDWGVGLALLRFHSISPEMLKSLPDVDSLLSNTKKLIEDDSVMISGFPYGSESLVLDSKTGKILNPQSDRHLIALVEKMIELVDVHGEFGMSGGGTWDADGKKLIGLLSHQVLLIQSGGPTRVFNWRGEAMEDHILAIPSGAISVWIKNVLKGGNDWFMERFLDSQILNKAVVNYGPFQFVLVSPANSDGGIGGADGCGIGGADGCGIGGTGDSESDNSSIKVELITERIGNPIYEFSKAPDEKREYLRGIYNRLMKHEEIVFTGFVSRKGDSVPGSYAIKKMESMSQFMHDFMKPGTVAINASSSSPFQKETQTATKQLAILSEKIANAPARLLIAQIKALVELASSDAWASLGVNEISAISDGSGTNDGWADLFSADFRAATDLYGSLQKIKFYIERGGK